jgi:hypothetical protein
MKNQGKIPHQEEDSRTIIFCCLAAIALVIYLYLFFTNA